MMYEVGRWERRVEREVVDVWALSCPLGWARADVFLGPTRLDWARSTPKPNPKPVGL